MIRLIIVLLLSAVAITAQVLCRVSKQFAIDEGLAFLTFLPVGIMFSIAAIVCCSQWRKNIHWAAWVLSIAALLFSFSRFFSKSTEVEISLPLQLETPQSTGRPHPALSPVNS